MDARTMGPIPTVISEPIFDAVTTCRKSAFAARGATPAALTLYMMKNMASAIPVHISFSFSGGGERGGDTSGSKCKIGFRKSSELPMEISPSQS